MFGPGFQTLVRARSELDQSFDVVDAGGFLVGVCGAERLLHQVLLLLLDLHHVLLHRVLHNELQQHTHT